MQVILDANRQNDDSTTRIATNEQLGVSSSSSPSAASASAATSSFRERECQWPGRIETSPRGKVSPLGPPRLLGAPVRYPDDQLRDSPYYRQVASRTSPPAQTLLSSAAVHEEQDQQQEYQHWRQQQHRHHQQQSAVPPAAQASLLSPSLSPSSSSSSSRNDCADPSVSFALAGSRGTLDPARTDRSVLKGVVQEVKRGEEKATRPSSPDRPAAVPTENSGPRYRFSFDRGEPSTSSPKAIAVSAAPGTLVPRHDAASPSDFRVASEGALAQRQVAQRVSVQPPTSYLKPSGDAGLRFDKQLPHSRGWWGGRDADVWPRGERSGRTFNWAGGQVHPLRSSPQVRCRARPPFAASVRCQR